MGKNNNILHVPVVFSSMLCANSMKPVLTVSWAGQCLLNVYVFPQMAENDVQNWQQHNWEVSRDARKAAVGQDQSSGLPESPV